MPSGVYKRKPRKKTKAQLEFEAFARLLEDAGLPLTPKQRKALGYPPLTPHEKAKRGMAELRRLGLHHIPTRWDRWKWRERPSRFIGQRLRRQAQLRKDKDTPNGTED